MGATHLHGYGLTMGVGVGQLLQPMGTPMHFPRNHSLVIVVIVAIDPAGKP